MTRRLLLAAAPPLILGAIHLALLVLLARIDTLRELLGSAEPSIPLALLLLFFYILRLVAIFAVPGWLVARCVSLLVERSAARPSSPR